MDKSRHIKKESILKALEQSLGIVTVACKKADVPRSTFYKWLNEDENFAQQVNQIIPDIKDKHGQDLILKKAKEIKAS